MSYTKQNFQNGQVLSAEHMKKLEIGILNSEFCNQENTIKFLTILAGETEGSVSFNLSKGAGPYAAIIAGSIEAEKKFEKGEIDSRIGSYNYNDGLGTTVREQFATVETLPWQYNLQVDSFEYAKGTIYVYLNEASDKDLSYVCILAKDGSAEAFLGDYLINQKVGKNVTGENFLIDGTNISANVYAEVFNDPKINIATGSNSHAEGAGTTSSGLGSHSEGQGTVASAQGSHAEGQGATASGLGSHAEGVSTETTAQGAHAEGIQTKARGLASHAEGLLCQALKDYSHAEGWGTIAASNNQHVEGKYNVEDAEGKYVHIVGNGTQDNQRANIHTLDWDGNAQYLGTVESAGLILTSPSGYKFLLTIEDDGTLISSPISE